MLTSCFLVELVVAIHERPLDFWLKYWLWLSGVIYRHIRKKIWGCYGRVTGRRIDLMTGSYSG